MGIGWWRGIGWQMVDGDGDGDSVRWRMVMAMGIASDGGWWMVMVSNGGW